MISDEMLRAAASDAGAALLASLPGEAPCAPPPRFERRMRRLIRRAAHPVLYPTLRTAACFALAVLLGGSLLLTAIPEARAAFFGWVSRQLSNMIVYDFTDREFAETPDVLYRPTWLPEGYTEYASQESETSGMIIYQNQENQLCSFTYAFASGSAKLHIIPDGEIQHTVQVGNIQADIYLSEDPSDSNSIIWEDPISNTLFSVTLPADEDVLIQIAESVTDQTP